MKKLFVSLLAVAGLAACATDDVVRELDNSTAIAFDSFVENATRADNVSINNENITEFSVWGYMADPTGYVFNDELVWKSGDAWTYTNIQYWMPGNLYHFAAFAGSRANVVGLPEAMNANDLGTITFTNVAGKEDILFAEAHVESATNSQEAVKFQFDHLLSKVKFTFKNGFANPNNYIVITGIEMDVPKVGTVLLDQDADYAWTLGAGTTTLAFGDMNLAEKLEIGKAAGSDEELLTIPAGVDQKYEVRFHVALYNGEKVGFESNKKVEITDINLLPGHSYNFVATINYDNVSDDPTKELKPIEFTCEVDEWIDALDPKDEEGKVDAVIENELKAAAQFGGVVTLSDNVVLTSPVVIKNDVTIDLNGFNISSASDVFEVAAGSLTIVGEGEIFAATDNGTPYCAVWAYDDAEVNIYGGDYKIGFPAGDYNDLIYAKENAVINIYGGKFYNSGKENAFVLNLKDGSAADINVYGGAFEKFNPANNNSEGANTNFCAEGYGVAVDGEWYTVVNTTVSTAADFKALLGVVDEVKLATDIDLSGSEWTPVGTSADLCKTSLDGQGHKIIGLNVSGDYAGLIAYAAEGVTVKNVIFEDVKVESEKFGAAVICVANENVTVENVTVSGTVNCDSYAAGIVCFNSYDEDPSITIKNCVNNATVNGNRAGGIGAWVTGNSVIENVVNNGDVTGATSAAGITNRIAGTITNAKNYGNIVGNGTEASAGIAGTQTDASTFEYCFNYGNVTTTKDNANSSAAGILGQTPSKAATLNYCANFGAIAAEKSYAAGIAYSLYGNVKASYCYNEGAVNGEDGAGAIAPKAQYGANDTANYCLNAGVISSAKGKVYQGSNKNNSCYYYAGGSLLNVSNNAVVAEADALAVLNGGADASFFSTEGNVIVVK